MFTGNLKVRLRFNEFDLFNNLVVVVVVTLLHTIIKLKYERMKDYFILFFSLISLFIYLNRSSCER